MLSLVSIEKLDTLSKIRSEGINPYPYSYNQTHHATEIIKNFESLVNTRVSVAGRVMKLRGMGGIKFADVLDGSGKIQVLFKADTTSAEGAKALKFVSLGDVIGVVGNVTKTQRGEISVEAKEVEILSKCLKALPDKFHGLGDVELRYRNRHLDLMVNPEVRKTLAIRAQVLKHIRDTLDSRGYLEVETPVLQPIYGGAEAKPFITHHNTLDANMYLRVSCELYLKKLIVGGIEKVYEVSKDFRNEAIDSTHNPEFTQVEFYEAYGDYNTYMALSEKLLSELAKKVHGDYKFTYQGKTLDFTPPFNRVYWVQELKEKYGLDILNLTDEKAVELARKENLDVAIMNAYHVADALFDKYIKSGLLQPSFVLDYPAYMCPLTKNKRGNPALSERFEFFVANLELGNCYSELTDPIEQRAKFEHQEAEHAKGDSRCRPATNHSWKRWSSECHRLQEWGLRWTGSP